MEKFTQASNEEEKKQSASQIKRMFHNTEEDTNIDSRKNWGSET